MHASLDGQHLSGAESLVEQTTSVEEELSLMLRRALEHPRGRADRISFQVDEIPFKNIVPGRLLNFSGYLVEDWQLGRKLACRLLSDAGVSKSAAVKALDCLANGAAPDGSSMRGAMLIDAQSGKRLETDLTRGVRVSRMDLTTTALTQLRQQLAMLNLDNSHVVEALTLATKVVSAPEIVAELCWSDDPDYTAGYVASSKAGYQRINHLKPPGEERGGRAFFVQQETPDLMSLIEYLEKTPFLIDQLGKITIGIPWSEQ